MKRYTINFTYTEDGQVEVLAHNETEAKERVTKLLNSRGAGVIHKFSTYLVLNREVEAS